MISFYLLWTLCYFVLLQWFAGRWPVKSPGTHSGKSVPAVTLLIPLRNEAENIASLALEIKKINYPFLEIILVDDQSEDGTYSMLEELAQKDSRIKLLRSPGIGKKAAIQFGVEGVDTELILCTDADCRFPQAWVERMTAPFADSKIQLVSGPVISAGQNTFFGRFQQLEWASILLVTQFFFTVNKPLMCSGANLAYRKSAFQAVRAYDGDWLHLSGDDEFLLKKIVTRFGEGSCAYQPYIEDLVFTNPQSTLGDLINQRVRWAGKWKVHREWYHAFSAVISFLIQCVWLSSVILLGLGTSGILAFLAVWAGKILAEKSSLGSVLSALGIRLTLIDFAAGGVLHPFFVLLVVVGTFRGKFVWKGRAN